MTTTEERASRIRELLNADPDRDHVTIQWADLDWLLEQRQYWRSAWEAERAITQRFERPDTDQ